MRSRNELCLLTIIKGQLLIFTGTGRFFYACIHKFNQRIETKFALILNKNFGIQILLFTPKYEILNTIYETMPLFFVFFSFLLGLIFGSFANCLIYRLPLKLPITGRSFCPKCKNTISWYDNIPVISFLLLGAKCRHCHKSISFYYPLIELITAIGFTLITYIYLFPNTRYEILDTKYFSWLGSFSLPFSLFIFFIFLLIFVIDLRHKQISSPLIEILVFVNLLALLASPSPTLFIHLATATSAAVFLLILFLVTRGHGLGWADIPLSFALGLLLGYPFIIFAVLLAFLTGAVVGLILILMNQAGLKTAVPFAPFLILGTIITLIFSEKLVSFFSF